MSLYQIIEDANNQVKEYLGTLDSFTPEQVGLDARCRGTVYIDFDSQQVIIETRYLKKFSYYGGFEYLNTDCVTEFGNYVIFDADEDESNRLNEVIDLAQEIVEWIT